jgi:hypothetical protein
MLRRKVEWGRFNQKLRTDLKGRKWKVTREGVVVDGKIALKCEDYVSYLKGTLKPRGFELKVVSKVGVMTSTTTPGPDGVLGTSDDETEISNENDWDYEAKEDGFECRYCGKILKTLRGIKNHVDNRVCR